LCFLPACLTGSAVEDENPDCAWDGSFGETGDLFDGPLLELGEVEGKDFIAWSEGQELNTVVGPQGLEMLMPFVRVVNAADDPQEESRCLSVHIRLTRTGGDPDTAITEGETANAFEFAPSSQDWLAGPIWTPFNAPLVGGEYDLELTVRDLDWASQLSIRVVVNS
jgi:hypothetical protein